MDTGTMIGSAIALLSSLVAFLASRSTNKATAEKTVADSWSKFSSVQTAELKVVKNKLDEEQRQRQQLEKEVIELRYQFRMLESSSFQLPIPLWLKDTKGIMLFLNDAYERTFLLPRKMRRNDYIGKTDFEVWPEDIARKFVENDQNVLQTGAVAEFQEDVTVGDKVIQYRILKYQMKNGNLLIGVAGVAFPK